MDPLSSTASVIAVIQISERILTLCSEYAIAVKGAKGDIERLNSEVTALFDVLKKVKDLADGPDAATLTALNALTKPIAQCSSELLAIRARLDPTRQTMNRLGLRSLKWPFKSKEVNIVIEALQRYKTTINMALNVDQWLATDFSQPNLLQANQISTAN
jgi:hypothetical protein